MAIEGPLKELGIHDVFQLLDLSRKTGVLRITSKLRQNQGTVYFDDGAVFYAEIQSNPHPLGELLLRAGKVAEADLSRAREMQQRGDRRRLGEILVGINAISERELERHIRQQVEEVVFELMSWQEGYFSFSDGPVDHRQAEAVASIRTEALLMEGARRIDEWSRIEDKIPHLGLVPVLAPVEGHDQGELDLLPPEWEVLAAIDGNRSVREIATSLARSEFDVAKIIFGLASAGVVALVDRGLRAAEVGKGTKVSELLAQAEAALAAGDVSGARAAAEAAAHAQAHDAAVHLLLGRVCIAATHDGEAEEHLRRALRLDPALAVAHRLLGDVVARQGRFGEAVESWQRWLQHGEHTPELLPEVDQVQEAVHAAQTLELLLRGSHG